jgi:DNA-binding NarL/FixJ family response regulator
MGVLRPAWRRSAAGNSEASDQPIMSVRITPAEGRVLTVLCDGASNSTIAAKLRLSPRTVESHISSLLEKTGCRSRTQLLLWAQRHRRAPVGSAPQPA